MKQRHGPIDLSQVDAPKLHVPLRKEATAVPQPTPIVRAIPKKPAYTLKDAKRQLRHVYSGFITHTTWVWEACKTASSKLVGHLPKWNPALPFKGFSTYALRTRLGQERLFASFMVLAVIGVTVVGSITRSYAIAEDVKSYAQHATSSVSTSVRTSIAKGEYLKAQVELKQLTDELASFQKLLPTSSLPLFANESWVLSLHTLIDATEELSAASDTLLVVYGNITQLISDAETLSPDEFKKRYKSLTEYIAFQWQLLKENVMPAIDRTYTVLQTIPLDLVPQDYKEKIRTGRTKLGELRQLFAKTDELLPSVLVMLGEREPKTYAILLQNSMEMRATGGFIGSIALVKVNDGWIEKMEFRDVYDFDGQVFEPIPAPAGIDTISKNFRLRDANYWPDFPTSANQVAWFLDKQKGPGVDGVIAINDTVIKDILAILGPLPLPGTDKNVSSDSFLPTISYMVESKLAGKQPKEILFAFSEIFIKEVKANIFKKPEILFSLLANLDQKNIVAFSFDQDVEDLFRKVGAAGEIFNYENPEKNRIDDYAMLVHTSIGANKSDYFVNESIDHASTVSPDGRAENTITLQRSYTFTPEALQSLRDVFETISPLTKDLERILLSGDNTHYLRWYLPAESRDIRIEGMNSKDVSISKDLGKTVVGFTQTLKPGETKKTELHYTIGTDVDSSKPLTYRIVAEKEPGGKNVPFSKTMKTASGTVIADYSNNVLDNKIQPLSLEEERKKVLLSNRSLISYLLYFGK